MIISTVNNIVAKSCSMFYLVHGCLLLVLMLNADPTIPMQVVIHVIDVKIDAEQLL